MKYLTSNEFSSFYEFVKWRHDYYCNQKYGGDLPYSFHLDAVFAQGEKFKHLINPSDYTNVVTHALYAHDLIEDARMTYNDIIKACDKYNIRRAEVVADIVYCVTDEKGKNRRDRKNDKYYKDLLKNKYAVFVKLADIAANTLFSKLTGSSMYGMYKKEFLNVKRKLYIDKYKEFFDYIENM